MSPEPNQDNTHTVEDFRKNLLTQRSLLDAWKISSSATERHSNTLVGLYTALMGGVAYAFLHKLVPHYVGITFLISVVLWLSGLWYTLQEKLRSHKLMEYISRAYTSEFMDRAIAFDESQGKMAKFLDHIHYRETSLLLGTLVSMCGLIFHFFWSL